MSFHALPSTLQLPGLLVVEDDPLLRSLLGDYFQLCGAPVWQASDAAQALDLLETYGSTISLVLMDLRLPGMDGRKMLLKLKQLYPDLPCCIMTGFEHECSEEELLSAGATRIYKKPFRSLPVLAEELFALGAGEDGAVSLCYHPQKETSLREASSDILPDDTCLRWRRPWILRGFS